jgi:hypothetical protein
VALALASTWASASAGPVVAFVAEIDVISELETA